MLFGSKSQKMPQAPQTGPAALSVQDQGQGQESCIFDVGGADFEARVMMASLERPVIVDFWAPWCGPCKQMMPALESVVTAARGEVLLAKVNIDTAPELAQALRIQSVPTVFAFFGGRPVDAFQGAQPESQIRTFVEKLVQMARASKPDALDIPESLKQAAQALSAGDLAGAQGLYSAVLTQDEHNVEAYMGLVRTFIAADHLEQAESLVTHVPPEIAKQPQFSSVRTALELAQKKPSGPLADLARKVLEHPADQQAKIDLAEAHFSGGQKQEALDTLLESIAQDRDWNEQAARKALLRFFEALGHADPMVIETRKKLSRLLFS